MARPRVALVIPALNEEVTIAAVVREIPRDAVDDIIVVDGDSADRTAERARRAGAQVVVEPRRGYGRACAAGAAAACAGGAGIVAFMDGDGSDDPAHLPALLAPILSREADFSIGSRAGGPREPGSMGWHQVAAGRLLGAAIGLLYGVHYTDMCALRAIAAPALARLDMREMTYGWNLEMQMRAARAGMRVREMPVAHRRRAGGRSKVAGTLRGSVRAGARILATMARVALESHGGRVG